jgi:hypothetical protein
MNVTTGKLPEPPLEYRAEREKMILAECDDRSAIEKLIDFITAARMSRAIKKGWGSLLCLCCGCKYNPSDLMDGESVFLCYECTEMRKSEEDEK